MEINRIGGNLSGNDSAGYTPTAQQNTYYQQALTNFSKAEESMATLQSGTSPSIDDVSDAIANLQATLRDYESAANGGGETKYGQVWIEAAQLIISDLSRATGPTDPIIATALNQFSYIPKKTQKSIFGFAGIPAFSSLSFAPIIQ